MKHLGLTVAALLAFLLIGCAIAARKHRTESARVSRIPSAHTSDDTYPEVDWFDNSVKYGDPSVEDILRLTRQSNVTTVQEALKVIKKEYPRYFSLYTLMYHSGSLQDSTYANPRAIVFGESGRTIITFNESFEQFPGDTGHKRTSEASIEVMDFNVDGGHTFREIEFTKEQRGPSGIDLEDLDKKLSTKNARVSIGNPNKCMMCHGFARSLPRFENYFVWPGAYGSDDDNIFRDMPEMGSHTSLSRVFMLKPGARDVERESYLAFEAARKKNPKSRYYELGEMPAGFGDPFCPAELGYVYNFEAMSCGGPGNPREGNGYETPELRPNRALNSRLMSQIMALIAKDLVKIATRDQILGVFQGALCYAYPDQDPEIWKPVYEQGLKIVDQMKADHGDSLDRRRVRMNDDRTIADIKTGDGYRDADLDRIRTLFPGRLQFDYLAVTQFMFLNYPGVYQALKAAGQNLQYWSMSSSGNLPVLHNGDSAFYNLTDDLATLLKRKYPQEDWDAYRQGYYGGKSKACK